MELMRFSIDGPVLITPTKWIDERGFLSETYSIRNWEPLIGSIRFVQENHTVSLRRGTLRGLHFQKSPAEQGKLVRVIRGAVHDVVVDIRRRSPTFGRHVAVELTAANWQQLWVPPGFAHGFYTLEPNTEVMYKLTSYYSPEHDGGIAWDDPTLAISWPIAKGSPILSERDRKQPLFAELPACFE